MMYDHVLKCDSSKRSTMFQNPVGVYCNTIQPSVLIEIIIR